MILFFRTPSKSVIAVESNHQLTPDESNKLCWLFGEAVMESEENLKGCFVGPRREMITPWSTNAVEITQNMGPTVSRNRSSISKTSKCTMKKKAWRFLKKKWTI